MTTYHQDIMFNFSCVHDRFTVFQNMHKRTCPCQLFHAKDQFHYNIVQNQY